MAAPACENDEKALKFIEEITRNADTVQKDVLIQILTQNAQTEYLKSFKLDGATDRQRFKSKIPVVTYEDLRPLIRRIADGDQSPILTALPVSELHISSGTSGGEPKLIPIISEETDRRKSVHSLLMPVINQYVKGLDKGKALYFKFTRAGTRTPGGLVAQSTTTSPFRSYHSTKARPYDPYNVYTSPDEAILCVDAFQSMYAQMLCGLYDHENVLQIGATFATILLRAIKFLQLNWQQLTHDIRTGSLNPKVTDVSLRECMTRVQVRPDPSLADFVAHECGKDNWEGIITRIWPNTKYLQLIVTGAMAQYIPNLDYYSGGLPIVSMVYASSECFFGINLNPMCKPSEISYTFMPHMAYFEFMPHEPDSSELTCQQLVDLVDVKMGMEYEPVITTYAGLYRYRMDDILRVTGFHNSAPQFQFIRRKNVLLSIDAEKTNEAELQAGVERASQLLHEFNTSLIEYTSYADTTTIPGHYVLYWELSANDSNNSPGDNVLDQCCLEMEESLNSMYRVLRVVHQTIGPLEIRVVNKGTFEKLMDYAITKGASVSQYKVPRCVSVKPIVDLLDSQVVSRHFSPSLPQWTSHLKSN